jgi:hypothetical protein
LAFLFLALAILSFDCLSSQAVFHSFYFIQIKPNLSSKIQIKDYSNAKTIIVPLSIVSENAEGEQYVYIAENVTKIIVVELMTACHAL